MKEFLAEQKNFLNEVSENFASMSDIEVSSRESGKWSKKEILGHLIDSASNNHQRFVRAQFTDDLIFPGYDQDKWVRVQDYQNINWHSLVELWKEFNFLIIHLAGKIPEDVLRKTRTSHNLDKIAWKEIPANEPVSLEYFIKDYFGHLRHHVDKILE